MSTKGRPKRWANNRPTVDFPVPIKPVRVMFWVGSIFVINCAFYQLVNNILAKATAQSDLFIDLKSHDTIRVG
jgi:hypothetical protein